MSMDRLSTLLQGHLADHLDQHKESQQAWQERVRQLFLQIKAYLRPLETRGQLVINHYVGQEGKKTYDILSLKFIGTPGTVTIKAQSRLNLTQGRVDFGYGAFRVALDYDQLPREAAYAWQFNYRGEIVPFSEDSLQEVFIYLLGLDLTRTLTKEEG